MVGQKKLLEQINNYTFDNIPRTLLFVGEVGSGKHTIISELAKQLNLTIVNIAVSEESEDLTDKLITYRQCPIPKIYLIDLIGCESKKQNRFLKFIEEPSKNMLVVVLAETEATILPTILNRCYKIYMEPYTVQELKQIRIYPDDHIYDICKTPGQVLAVDYKTFTELYQKAELLSTIPPGNYANTVSLACLINYNDKYDKWDFDLFLRTLEWVAYKKYIDENNSQAFRVWQTVNQYKQKMVDKILLKENFMLNLLTNIWYENKVK